MAQNSKIEWTDHTFNPWMGCTKVSPGCQFCYAERDMDKHWKKVKWGPHGTRVKTSPKYWKEPLKWNEEYWRECCACGRRAKVAPGMPYYLCGCGSRETKETRQRVFCASLADVFEDNPQLANWRGELFQLIDQTPHLDWLILTKRPERIFSLGTDAVGEIFDNWLMRHKNVWLGTSIENQKTARQRIPELQKICAHVHFLSIEPLLDYIDLSMAVEPSGDAWDELNAEWDDDDEPEEFIEECEAECDWINYGNDLVENPAHREWEYNRRARAGFKTLKRGAIDWVIAGGESGPDARPMDPNWVRSLRDECQQAGIPFFFKQWGEWTPDLQGLTEYGMSTLRERGKGRVAKGYFVLDDGTILRRAGKHQAGRLLDGKEWREMP